MTASSPQRQPFATVPLSRLRADITLRTPIYEARDGRDVLLLAAGTTITEILLARLAQRGIDEVRMQESEYLRLTGSHDSQPARRKRTPKARGGISRKFKVSADSFRHRVRRRGASSYGPATHRDFTACYEQSLQHVEGLVGELTSSATLDGGSFNAASAEFLRELVEDFDLFVSFGIQPESDGYPVRHSVQTAMLATAIGTTLGLSEKELRELSVGCLIHDIGMLHVESTLYQTERLLDDIEFLEITKHPAIAFDLIRSVRELTTGTRMVVYQMHERCDGSGYPRRRNARNIHQLAKIAAVADVFLALISSRPHRPGMLPYSAVAQLIQEAHEGRFDSHVVRGLLRTVSLFPIGSFVELNDGRMGRVIRANGENFTRPVVEILPKRKEGDSDGEIIDLANEESAAIVRAVKPEQTEQTEQVPQVESAATLPPPDDEPDPPVSPDVGLDHWN